MKKQHKHILIFITLFGWVSYIVAIEPNNLFHINEMIRKILNLPILLIILLVGIKGWNNEKEIWLKYLWILIYSFEIIILLSFGILNKFEKSESISNFRNFVSSLRHFLISPLPYAVLLYLLKVTLKEKPKL